MVVCLDELQEFFVAFKSLVEETYTMNGNAPVLLIAHSMGGPLTLVFLQQQTQAWKDKHIRALVTLSGAWGGSVKALKVFAVGKDLWEDSGLNLKIFINVPLAPSMECIFYRG